MSELSPETLRSILKSEIRAKLSLRIPPCYGSDDWYDKWVETMDSATEGIMDVLNKYDIKENEE
jgi:hypothetical protein